MTKNRRRVDLRQAAILRLMAVVILLFARAAGGRQAEETIDPPPLAGLLVVGNLRDESVTVIDLSAGAGQARVLALPGAPHELVVLGGRLYATVPPQDLLVEIEPGAPALLRSLPVPGTPHGLALSADGRTLAAGLDGRASVALVDIAAFQQRGLFESGAIPHALVYDPENVLFVAEAAGNTVAAFGPSGERRATAGRLPEGLAVAGDYVVSADAQSSTLTVVDRRTLAHVHTIAVNGQPVRVIALPDGNVAAALTDTGEVVVVSPGDGVVVRRIPVAARPDGLCLSPDGAYLAVVSNATNTVEVFIAGSWRKAGEAATGNGPGSCAWLSR